MSSLSVPAPWSWRGLALRMNPAQLRFWLVVLPIHAVAFTTLYFGASHLLDDAYAQAGAAAARRQIEQLVREMPTMMPRAHGETSPHLFGHLLSMHQPIQLHLYSTASASIWPRGLPEDRDEVERVRRILADPARRDDIWIEKLGHQRWLRGVVRVNTGADCAPCHQPGKTLGAASMRIDFTDDLALLHNLLRTRLVYLFALWLALVGAVAVVVRLTVRRSLSRLEDELHDAAAGRSSSSAANEVPLDPASAAFHGRLRDFLRRHREREVEVVSRLAHADQLATLGQLSAGLAHEIKNPLAGIQGALEVLKHEASAGETARLYDEMLDELKRVNGILQRLLESGRPAPLRLARANLAKLVSETVELLRPALGRRKVELAAHVDGELGEIRVDGAKVRQVLVNLIQNASEAMGEGGGHVTVRASAVPGREGGVALVVEDDGPGISRDNFEHVFDPFFTTKFTGTGLGLTISKSLIEQHGGRLHVESEEGRGTTFFILLPTGATPPPPAPEAAGGTAG
jgi:signal transduction histidine kinase